MLRHIAKLRAINAHAFKRHLTKKSENRLSRGENPVSDARIHRRLFVVRRCSMRRILENLLI